MRSTYLYRILTISLGVISTILVHGQNEVDALRISSLFPGGTARSNGMANAYGAVGADGACIGINPAGFGLYRTSELTFTPSLEINNALSTYYGPPFSDTRARPYFSNMAFVLNKPFKKGGEWRSNTFGVVFDRQQSHQYRLQALGTNVPSSILQRFANEANGTSIDDLNNDQYPFSASLAWYTYGIDPALDAAGDPILNAYASAIPLGSPTEQIHTVDSRGSNSSTSFFYGANYLDRLYVGASVSIASHRTVRNTVHKETSIDESLDLKDVTYTENLTTIGNGLNLKFGLIGRVTERLRIGASIHSPQWMRLNDAYSYDLSTGFRSADSLGRSTYSASSPDGAFTYNVRTPLRAVISAVYVAGKHGLFSMDYEYADYSRMRFSRVKTLADRYDFAQENDAIGKSFRVVHTIRVGTEWRTGSWYYRLGWGIVPDAYKTTDTRHGLALKNYAFGIGYRSEHLGIELGLNYTDRSTKTFPYDPALVDPISERLTTYRGLVTVSIRP